MWFYYAKSAVSEDWSGSKILLWKHIPELSFSRLGRITTVASILRSVRSEKGSDSAWGLLSSFFRVGWTDHFSPSVDCIRSNKFQTNCKVGCHKLLQPGEELFADVLGIESLCIFLVHFKQLEVANRKIFFSFCYDFAYLQITIWFYHPVSPWLFPIYLLETDSPNKFLRVN